MKLATKLKILDCFDQNKLFFVSAQSDERRGVFTAQQMKERLKKGIDLNFFNVTPLPVDKSALHPLSSLTERN